MEHVDVALIGGGQSGLATAHALIRQGLRPVVLEAPERAAGSWPRYYESLTLFSPARYSSLPGMPFGGGAPGRYPHRDEVIDYLTAYASRLDADIRTGHRVTEVRAEPRGFVVGPGGRRRAGSAGCCCGIRHVRPPPPSDSAGSGGLHRHGAACRRVPQHRAVCRAADRGGGRR